jgi:hypothetical protein
MDPYTVTRLITDTVCGAADAPAKAAAKKAPAKKAPARKAAARS